MKRLAFSAIVFILIIPAILYAQKIVEPGFSSKILDAGLGKVAIGDIDNDGFTCIVGSVRSEGIGEVMAGTYVSCCHLTLGFAEKNDFVHVSQMINSAYKSLKISIGEITKADTY